MLCHFFLPLRRCQEFQDYKRQKLRQKKGYGFIEMPINSEADQAIKALDGKRYDGRNIVIRQVDSSKRRRKKKRSFSRRNY